MTLCEACAEEIRDPFARRYRYPFTRCTTCGPDAIRPKIAMCPECTQEIGNPEARRFGEPAAFCHTCGPAVELARTDGRACTFASYSMLDDVDAARTLLLRGEVVIVDEVEGRRALGNLHDDAAVAKLERLTTVPRAQWPLLGEPATGLELLIAHRVSVPIARVVPDAAAMMGVVKWQLRQRLNSRSGHVPRNSR
ncbi:MAG: hypothetical protein AAGA48_08455 [Myxococcota bacterium]